MPGVFQGMPFPAKGLRDLQAGTCAAGHPHPGPVSPGLAGAGGWGGETEPRTVLGVPAASQRFLPIVP